MGPGRAQAALVSPWEQLGALEPVRFLKNEISDALPSYRSEDMKPYTAIL